VIFRETRIAGALLIEPERHVDERGSFERIWCAREFAERGLDARIAQTSLSANPRRGTLRGLHYAVAPGAEAKVVRCVRGAAYDVLVDLRPASPTYRRWHAETISAGNGLAMYAPEGVAHGFLTLEDSTDLLYQISVFYDPACARGVRWNDPAFGVAWPQGDPILSDRDRSYPDYDPVERVGTR
jgi:dTDP-4-dehydrorhamnose 3,5-epimerase